MTAFFCSFSWAGECVLNVAVPTVKLKQEPIKAMSWWDKRAITMQFDTILKFNERFELEPGIAKKWYFSKDKLLLTLEIREGILFSDGTPLDAKLIVESLRRYFGPDSVDHDRTKSVRNVSVVGKNQIQIQFNTPFIPFVYYLATPRAAIYKISNAHQLVGSGPWVLKEQNEKEKSLVYVANPNYFLKHPLCQKVQLKEIPSAQLLSAIKEKQVDLVEYYADFDKSMRQMLETASVGFRTVDFPSFETSSMFFTLNKPNTPQLKERRWLAEQIMRSLKNGKIIESSESISFLPAGLMEKSDPMPSEKSQKPLSSELSVYIPDDERVQIIEKIAHSISSSNGHLLPKPVSFPELYSLHSKGLVSAHIETLTLQIPDAYGILSMYLGRAKENFSGFTNREYDKLINAAIQTEDLKSRNKLYQKAYQILERERLAIPLFKTPRMALVSEKIDGYVASTVGPYYSNYHVIRKSGD